MRFLRFCFICVILVATLLFYYKFMTQRDGLSRIPIVGLHGYIRITPKKTNKPLNIYSKQCAVVSSSGHMLNAGVGKEIDEAGFVIRMNNAPTVGYERDVGSKTSLRMVSHTSVPLLLKNATYYFQKSADTIYIFWGPDKNMRQDGKGRIFNALLRVAQKYPEVKLYAVTREKIQYCDNVFQNETGKNRMQSGAYLSTGFFTMVLAIEICDSIQVYGMINDKYCSQENHTAVPYHYYEKRWVDECRMYHAHERARRGGHRFITEKAIYARWASRKKLLFKHPFWAELEGVS